MGYRPRVRILAKYFFAQAERRETLRFTRNKIHVSLRDQSLSINYCPLSKTPDMVHLARLPSYLYLNILSPVTDSGLLVLDAFLFELGRAASSENQENKFHVQFLSTWFLTLSFYLLDVKVVTEQCFDIFKMSLSRFKLRRSAKFLISVQIYLTSEKNNV